LKVFYRWGALFGGDQVRFEEKEGDLRKNLLLECFLGLGHHSSPSIGGFLLLVILLCPWSKFLKRGTLSIEDLGASIEDLGGLTSLFHCILVTYSTYISYSCYSILDL
jgi:hypothetical protein